MKIEYFFQLKSDRAEYDAMSDKERYALDLIAKSLNGDLSMSRNGDWYRYVFIRHLYDNSLKQLGSVDAIIEYERTPKPTLEQAMADFLLEFPEFDEKLER